MPAWRVRRTSRFIRRSRTQAIDENRQPDAIGLQPTSYIVDTAQFGPFGFRPPWKTNLEEKPGSKRSQARKKEFL
jgi:hypothetical protein